MGEERGWGIGEHFQQRQEPCRCPELQEYMVGAIAGRSAQLELRLHEQKQLKMMLKNNSINARISLGAWYSAQDFSWVFLCTFHTTLCYWLSLFCYNITPVNTPVTGKWGMISV